MSDTLTSPAGPKLDPAFEAFLGANARGFHDLPAAKRLDFVRRFEEIKSQSNKARERAAQVEKELTLRYGDISKAPALDRARLADAQREAGNAQAIRPADLPAVSHLIGEQREVVGKAIQRRAALQKEAAGINASSKDVTLAVAYARERRLEAIADELAQINGVLSKGGIQ